MLDKKINTSLISIEMNKAIWSYFTFMTIYVKWTLMALVYSTAFPWSSHSPGLLDNSFIVFPIPTPPTLPKIIMSDDFYFPLHWEKENTYRRLLLNASIITSTQCIESVQYTVPTLFLWMKYLGSYVRLTFISIWDWLRSLSSSQEQCLGKPSLSLFRSFSLSLMISILKKVHPITLLA